LFLVSHERSLNEVRYVLRPVLGRHAGGFRSELLLRSHCFLEPLTRNLTLEGLYWFLLERDTLLGQLGCLTAHTCLFLERA
jgi:hypothetical protein